MERSGMLESITEYLLKVIKGRTSAVATTCMSSLFLNVTTGDQIISIILPSKMYGSAFDRLGLPRKLMSRSLEDGGTVTSVLVPWNSCGMTQSTVLGVATTIYAPYTLFCWISPLMSVIAAFVKQYVMKKEDQESDFVTISGQEEDLE